MHILVTGGAGFIGSHFVEYVVTQTSHTVTTIDLLTYAGSRDNLKPVTEYQNHKFIKGNIRERSLVEDLVDAADVIVNFAAESHVDRSIEGATSFVRTNVEGTQTLLDVAKTRDIEQFVQISTDEVYGHILEGEFSEDDRVEPRNPYAATKAGADMLAKSYYVTHNLPVKIIRSSNNYGPRQHPEKLIPKVIRRAADEEQIPVYGDGKNVREWTYVLDNVRAIWTVIQDGNPGEIYNVGSGVEKKNITLVKYLIEQVGASSELIEFVEDRPGHDQRYALDTKKIELLGWSPQLSFDEGIANTIEHYLGS